MLAFPSMLIAPAKEAGMKVPPDPAVLPYSRTNPEFKVKCPTDGCGATIHLEEYVTRECFVERNVGQRA
jgi:hypothetical protein